MERLSALMLRRGMSRGILVLDENIYDLEPWLQNHNFRVKRVTPGTPDSKISQDLSFRIFFTKNPRDFVLSAWEFEFGLIGVTDAAMADPAKVAKKISDAYARYKLRTTIPFRLTISPTTTSIRYLTEENVAKENPIEFEDLPPKPR